MVYGDTIDFYILVSYPGTLLNSFNRSNSFLFLFSFFWFLRDLYTGSSIEFIHTVEYLISVTVFSLLSTCTCSYFISATFIISYFLLLEIISSFIPSNILNIFLFKVFFQTVSIKLILFQVSHFLTVDLFILLDTFVKIRFLWILVYKPVLSEKFYECFVLFIGLYLFLWWSFSYLHLALQGFFYLDVDLILVVWCSA